MRLVLIVLVSVATAPVVFVAMARSSVGEPRPVGTVCAFEHDPGSGQSAEGRVEHRGWLLPREACVHATDGENIEPVGLTPFIGAAVAPVVSFVALAAIVTARKRRRGSLAGADDRRTGRA